MTKRLVEIDDSLLERARAACGERTIKATVEAGLQALAAQAAGAEHVRLLRSTDFDLEALEHARQPRSAFKHGYNKSTIWHPLDHAVTVIDLEPDADPAKVLAIGPDRPTTTWRSSGLSWTMGWSL